MKKILLYTLFTIISVSAFSQKKKIEILQSNKMVGDKDVRKLYGNVIFKHKKIKMYCDSAYFYSKENRFQAFSNIKIIDDNVTITADSLHYTSATSIAQLRGDVLFVDDDTRLTTSYLDYNSKERIGYYYNKGKITDSENVLTSEKGTYLAQTHEVFFKTDVMLVNPDYNITTDTLMYNTQSETAFFFGPSDLISKENHLYTENGWYNTQTKIAQFYQNSFINTDSQFVYGDNLYYNRNTDRGIARENVIMKDTVEKISLYGDYSNYEGDKEQVYITGNITMVQEFETDSLFLHSDSVYFRTKYTYNDTLTDSTKYHLLQTYNKVRFYKGDVQGVCDSLDYNSKDSCIILFSKPILWSDENQITGKEIKLQIENNVVSKILISENSFIVSEDSKDNYNQMKGVALTGYIKDNALYKVDIRQNGETVYFLRDGNEIIGINKANCDSISLYIKNGEAQKIVFKNEPSGALYPPSQLPKEAQIISEFKWLDKIRPKDKNDIYIWKEEEVVE